MIVRCPNCGNLYFRDVADNDTGCPTCALDYDLGPAADDIDPNGWT